MKPKLNSQNKEALSEEETRRRWFNLAAKMGVAMDLKLIFEKYDNLLANTKSESEANHIKKLAAVEIYKLLFSGGLTINGEVVIPADENEKIIKI